MTFMRKWTMQTLLDRCEDEGDCLLWKHTVNSAGHPTASIEGKNRLVRRFVYEHLMGKKLDPMSVVLPRCKNLRCCSPRCLVCKTRSEAMTETINTLMANPVELRKRQQWSVDNGFARLDYEKAAEIRASDESAKVIANRMNVSLNCIYEVRRGKSWRAPSVANSVFNLGG